jgi:fluoride exporter
MSPRRTRLRELALVMAGGSVGALARVGFSALLPTPDGAFPTSTFVENVLGAFLLGLVLTLLAERVLTRPEVRLAVCTGALGAFTTYSTLAVELTRLDAVGHRWTALVYAAASLAFGLAAGLAGIRIGRVVPRSPRRRRPGPETEPGVAP